VDIYNNKPRYQYHDLRQEGEQVRCSNSDNAATMQMQQQQQRNSKDKYNNKQRYQYHDLRQEGEQV
jgi:hypothetical protein